MTHTHSKSIRGAFGVAVAAAVLLVSGCAGTAAGAGSDEPTASPSTKASAAAGGSEKPAGQPEAGVDAATAAEQLIQINLDLLADGDFAGACTLYLPAYREQLTTLADPGNTDCADALEVGYVTSVEASFDAADEAGELPLTPFFYVPSAITVDSAQVDASETWLAYVPGAALSSNDPQEFRDGTGIVPGWLARSLYVQQDDAGVWRFASSTEYKDR